MSINGAVREIIGKKPRLTPREAEFLVEIYAKLTALAVHNGLAKARCSRSTFLEHFNHDTLIAGPWEWDIDDKTPHGELVLVRLDKTEIGTLRVSELVVH